MVTFRHLCLRAFLVSSLWASQLYAAPITVDLDFTGFPSGNRTGWIYDDADGNSHVRAGMFGFDVNGSSGPTPWDWGDRLEAFCIEIAVSLSSNAVTYSVNSAADYFNDAGRTDLVGRLYTGYRDLVTNALSSAAFQLALWEVVNETDDSLDLFSGSFTTSRFGNQTDNARNQAQSWLDSLGGITNNYRLHVLESPHSQNLLVVSPGSAEAIAEPVSLGLLGIGLSMIGLRFRRRR